MKKYEDLTQIEKQVHEQMVEDCKYLYGKDFEKYIEICTLFGVDSYGSIFQKIIEKGFDEEDLNKYWHLMNTEEDEYRSCVEQVLNNYELSKEFILAHKDDLKPYLNKYEKHSTIINNYLKFKNIGE